MPEPNRPFVVGLRGPIGVGKTTLAWAMQKIDTRIIPMSFAGPIRCGLAHMGITKREHPDAYRQAAQIIGTEIARGMIGEDHWVNQARNHIASDILPEQIVVFDDVRFRNEIAFCDLCIHLRRGSYTPPPQSHTSESLAFTTFDHICIDVLEVEPKSILSFILEHRRQRHAEHPSSRAEDPR